MQINKSIGDVKKYMYQIGDLIIYGNYGVCRVDAIGMPDIPGLDNEKVYYTLFPLYQDGRIFTPIDSNIFMRPVITCTEAQQLISHIPSISEYDYYNNDVKLLECNYKESMQTHDCANLIKVIKTIYAKRVNIERQGKKLGQMEENFMKRAEDLLYGELAVTLGIQKGKVKDYIEDTLNELDKKLIING